MTEELQSKLKQLTEANAELSHREVGLRSEAEEAKQRLAAANERCNELTAAAEEAKQGLAAANERCNELTAAAEEAKQGLAAANERCNELTAAAEEAKQGLAAANERCNELTAVAGKQKAQAEAAESKLTQTENLRSQLTKDLSRLRNQTAETKRRLTLSESALASTKIELASLSRTLNGKYIQAGDERSLVLQVDDRPIGALSRIIAAQRKSSSLPWLAQRRSKALMHTRYDLIGASGLFDPEWYLATYPDVAEAKLNALDHFNEHGSLELRSPGPLFDSNRYWMEHPDIRAAGVEAFMHYLIYGRGEGRNKFSVAGGSQDAGLPQTAAQETGIMNDTHFQELIKGFCVYALKRSVQSEEISYWRKIIVERGLSPFIDGVLGSPEARSRKDQEEKEREKKREEATLGPLRRLDEDAARDRLVDELVQEVSGSKVHVWIAQDILDGLPFPMTSKLSSSTAIELDRSYMSDIDHKSFTIAFRRKDDNIDLSSPNVVYVVLLDSHLRTSDVLSKPTYRVGRTADMAEERKEILRQLSAGWEVSPVVHLHRVDGFDRASLSPSVVVQQLADEPFGNHNLACQTARQLVLSHYMTRDAAEALLYLDRFDRRLGSTFADRYKAITGAYA